MQNIIIYGEFLDESTTGIAYINNLLREVFCLQNYQVSIFKEPRSKDYKLGNKIIKKRFYLKDFLKLIFNILKTEKHDLSFITLSQSKIGLLKTILIGLLLKIRSQKLYIYIHRGDLHNDYENSILKKNLIDFIFRFSNKIIFLSEIISGKFPENKFKRKFIIIPNALNIEDTRKSKIIYKNNIQNKFIKNENQYKFVYFGNIHTQKGFHEIIDVINNLNEKFLDKKIKIDIYGMRFEIFSEIKNQVEYKGLLNHKDRLDILSKYDFLISASKNEGMPMILIECLSIGLPFITTNVGAISDLLPLNYPYVSSPDFKGIYNVVKKVVYDLEFKKNKIKNIVSQNNKLFLEKFQYQNYLNNVNKCLINN